MSNPWGRRVSEMSRPVMEPPIESRPTLSSQQRTLESIARVLEGVLKRLDDLEAKP